MLKPYLDSKSSNAGATSTQVVTDEDRIKSIKQHFDTLTALTAQDLVSETASKHEVESSNDDDNLDETTIDDYDPDPGDVKKLREGQESWKYKKEKSKERRMAKKRSKEMQEKNESPAKKEKIDMENVDFSQYSSGVGRNVNTFDPMKEFRDGAGKKKNYGKPKHRSNNKSGKTMTYKKK